jgi:dephospho-CoA kinase
MLRIGLTGGVASGKSTVGKMLSRRGAHYLQADSLAHQLYAPGTAVYHEIVRRFGKEILDADETINRSKLANLAFPGRISELNAIVHPGVIQAQNQWMREVERSDPDAIAVVEAALIIEAGAAKNFDRIIVVTCGAEYKVARYAARSGMSPEAARAEVARRSAAQLTDAGKIRRADYVIDNSGSPQQTEPQVEKIWKELKSL